MGGETRLNLKVKQRSTELERETKREREKGKEREGGGEVGLKIIRTPGHSRSRKWNFNPGFFSLVSHKVPISVKLS